jgi:hypothetical protein
MMSVSSESPTDDPEGGEGAGRVAGVLAEVGGETGRLRPAEYADGEVSC